MYWSLWFLIIIYSMHTDLLLTTQFLYKLILMIRWLFVTEEDIKSLPCFQVKFWCFISGHIISLQFHLLINFFIFLWGSEWNINCNQSSSWYYFRSPRSWWGIFVSVFGLSVFNLRTQKFKMACTCTKWGNVPSLSSGCWLSSEEIQNSS